MPPCYYVKPEEGWDDRCVEMLEQINIAFCQKEGSTGGVKKISEMIGVSDGVLRSWMKRSTTRSTVYPDAIISRLGAIAELKQQILGVPVSTREIGEELFGSRWAKAYFRSKKGEGCGEKSVWSDAQMTEIMQFAIAARAIQRQFASVAAPSFLIAEPGVKVQAVGGNPRAGVTGTKPRKLKESGGDSNLCKEVIATVERSLRSAMGGVSPIDDLETASQLTGLPADRLRSIFEDEQIRKGDLEEIAACEFELIDANDDPISYVVLREYYKCPCVVSS